MNVVRLVQDLCDCIAVFRTSVIVWRLFQDLCDCFRLFSISVIVLRLFRDLCDCVVVPILFPGSL